jgi:hypothetical protein
MHATSKIKGIMQLIYALGAFHTNRNIDKQPKTFVTTTSAELSEQVKKLGVGKLLHSHHLLQDSTALSWVLQN